MNNWALGLLLLLSVALIAGCTMGPATSQGNDLEAQGAINDFGETLLDENSDVEIGELI